MAAKKRESLGRGLDALLGSGDAKNDSSAAEGSSGELRTLGVASIRAGKHQPRRHFDEDLLN